MRRFKFLLQKEFIQVFRNRFMLPVILVMPVVQLILLSYAANFEVKNIRLATVDQSHSTCSRDLIRHFGASGNFEFLRNFQSVKKARESLDKGSSDMVLVIPADFHTSFYDPELNPNLRLIIDAINGSKAGVANGYSMQIIRDFNQQTSAEIIPADGARKNANIPSLKIHTADWFNPHLDYKAFMVPGILALLVTMIGLFLTSMNIVREKEIGTIEQINVTPIRKSEFIAGKLFPFWVIGIGEMALGLCLGKLFFDIPLEGSLSLVFLFSALYLLVVLGLGMFISTFTNTQQQAMFLAWFFMVVFILMSGLFTPIESMPFWAKTMTWFNPVAYMVELMRMVLLKGSGFIDVMQKLVILLAFGLVVNVLAVLNYRKTSG